MKITWKSVYFPIGEWQNGKGTEIKIQGNFRCTHQGTNLLCIMYSVTSRGGHGEGSITDDIPAFVDAETLKPYQVKDGDFVEIDESILISNTKIPAIKVIEEKKKSFTETLREALLLSLYQVACIFFPKWVEKQRNIYFAELRSLANASGKTIDEILADLKRIS